MGPKRNIERIMKRLASALLVGFGALCLHADQQQTTTATPGAPMTVLAAPPAAADSALVRAAKSTSHPAPPKGKKKIVITNETLSKSGGHITTGTNTQAALPPAAPRVDPLIEAQKKLPPGAEARAKREAEQKKKAEAAERANAIYEGDDPEGIYEDPARTEGRMEKQSPTTPSQPPTIQVQKPPTSSR
jgi:hypothetical protein